MKILLINIMVFMSVSSYSQLSILTQSASSLLVEMYNGQTRLGTATGFVIKTKSKYYLVTNYHVVTARNPWNNYGLIQI